jgi:hypothetical protein
MKATGNLGFVKPKSRDKFHDREQLRKEREAGRHLENEKKPTDSPVGQFLSPLRG